MLKSCKIKIGFTDKNQSTIFITQLIQSEITERKKQDVKEEDLAQDKELIEKTKRNLNKLLNKTSELRKIEKTIEICQKQNEELKKKNAVLE